MWLRGRRAAQHRGSPHSTSLVCPKGPEEGKAPRGGSGEGRAAGAGDQQWVLGQGGRAGAAAGAGCKGEGARRACCDRVPEGLSHHKAGSGHHHSHTKQRPTMYGQITARYRAFTAAARSLHGCTKTWVPAPFSAI